MYISKQLVIFVAMNTITRKEIKLIHALHLKKERDNSNSFVAEGIKTVNELLPHFMCHLLIVTDKYINEHLECIRKYEKQLRFVTPEVLEKASLQQAPQQVIAVFEKPKMQSFHPTIVNENLCLMLDGIQDPGNLGTIIRIADWFGIRHIICSTQTADAFSPKVVQATMGAISRVKLYYTQLTSFLKSVPSNTPIYGTLLDGSSIYNTPLTPHGLLIMGNEGRGISEEVRKMVTHKLLIPSYPPNQPTSESLNVATATAIVCAEFRRRESKQL